MLYDRVIVEIVVLFWLNILLLPFKLSFVNSELVFTPLCKRFVCLFEFIADASCWFLLLRGIFSSSLNRLKNKILSIYQNFKTYKLLRKISSITCKLKNEIWKKNEGLVAFWKYEKLKKIGFFVSQIFHHDRTKFYSRSVFYVIKRCAYYADQKKKLNFNFFSSCICIKIRAQFWMCTVPERINIFF